MLIASNTTWAAGQTIDLSANVQIASGVTLTIAPGAVINGHGHKIEALGHLLAQGTPAQQIEFANVRFDYGHATSSSPGRITLSHAEVHGGTFLAPTGYGSYGSFSLTDSVITHLGSYIYAWYPEADSFIERNVFISSGGISSGVSDGHDLFVRNNVFAEQTTPYAVENWAAYNGTRTVVEFNSFLSTDRVALSLPAGYDSAAMVAENNFFNTIEPAVIDAMVRDRTDSLSYASVIDVTPNLSQPHQATPIYNLMPSGANKTITAPNDTPYTFVAADFGFSDIDDDTLLAVKITTLPTSGSLTNRDVAVAAGQVISEADVTAGYLKFTSARNSHTNFTFQVQDNGGTANGSIDTDTSPNTITVDLLSVNGPHSIDFNPDNTDVLWQRTDGTVMSLHMNGATIASFAMARNAGPQWEIVSTGDYNSDHASDALFRRDDGSLLMYTVVHNQQQSTNVGQVGNEWQMLGSSDFNADGRDDILWQRSDGTLMIFNMNGAQITAAPIVGQIGAEWDLQGTGDYNGDGSGDMLWRRGDGSLLMFEITNNQVQDGAMVGQVGTEWQIAGSGDFNGDANTDILWRRGDGALMIFNMDGAQLQSAVNPGQVGNEWDLEGTADYNSDGTADLLWHRDDGALMLFEMADNQMQHASIIGRVGTEWHIL